MSDNTKYEPTVSTKILIKGTGRKWQNKVFEAVIIDVTLETFTVRYEEGGEKTFPRSMYSTLLVEQKPAIDLPYQHLELEAKSTVLPSANLAWELLTCIFGECLDSRIHVAPLYAKQKQYDRENPRAGRFFRAEDHELPPRLASSPVLPSSESEQRLAPPEFEGSLNSRTDSLTPSDSSSVGSFSMPLSVRLPPPPRLRVDANEEFIQEKVSREKDVTQEKVPCGKEVATKLLLSDLFFRIRVYPNNPNKSNECGEGGVKDRTVWKGMYVLFPSSLALFEPPSAPFIGTRLFVVKSTTAGASSDLLVLNDWWQSARASSNVSLLEWTPMKR